MLGTGTVPFFKSGPGFYQLTLIAKSEQSECPSDTSIQSFLKVVCSVDAAHSFMYRIAHFFVEYNGNPYFNSAYLINTGGDTLLLVK